MLGKLVLKSLEAKQTLEISWILPVTIPVCFIVAHLNEIRVTRENFKTDQVYLLQQAKIRQIAVKWQAEQKL